MSFFIISCIMACLAFRTTQAKTCTGFWRVLVIGRTEANRISVSSFSALTPEHYVIVEWGPCVDWSYRTARHNNLTMLFSTRGAMFEMDRMVQKINNAAPSKPSLCACSSASTGGEAEESTLPGASLNLARINMTIWGFGALFQCFFLSSCGVRSCF